MLSCNVGHSYEAEDVDISIIGDELVIEYNGELLTFPVTKENLKDTDSFVDVVLKDLGLWITLDPEI